MSIEQTLERIAVAVETLVAMQQDTNLAPMVNPTPTVPTVAPVATGPAPVATGPAPVATGPAGATPPVAPVPTLDEITDAANTFHRAHPERAGEIMGILGAVGATSMSTIPPNTYPTVLENIKALGA